MSVLLHATEFRVVESESILSFERFGSDMNPGWDRYLMIDGKRAYHLGNVCGTCAFFFERLEGANRKISAGEISHRLRSGVKTLDSDLVHDLARVLPNGDYRVTLLELPPPELAQPGGVRDYFIDEQVELWGIDSFWNLPHDPRTEYYRAGTRPLGDHRRLFEFVVPLVPSNWLHADTLTEYEGRLADGDQPTALAMTTLDVKQPSDWEGDPAITEHWCLTHYLLDGHHKTLASARAQRPITLVSFLAADESIASSAQIDSTLTALRPA